MWPERIIISVCPSGFAPTSVCVAVRPFAPGRFSTTIGTPSTFSRSLAMSREIMSAVPPAVKPTSQRIGPDGQLCALALPVQAASKSASSETRANFIVSSLFATMLADMRRGIQPGLDQSVPIRRVRASKEHRSRMADDIPYNKVFELEPGRAEEVAPGVRRIVANNPGAVHLQGDGQLHRRARQGRDHRSRPGRSARTSRRCSMPCAARP